MTDNPLVLLVGHCGFDTRSLTKTIKKAIPDARVESVRSSRDLKKHLPVAELLLVNRALTSRFDASDGVELIGNLQSPAPAAMLISNFPDAQQAAEAAGAAPGFGKSNMHTPEAVQRIAQALKNKQAPDMPPGA